MACILVTGRWAFTWGRLISSSLRKFPDKNKEQILFILRHVQKRNTFPNFSLTIVSF